MDKKLVFVKTGNGENEVNGKGVSLSGDLKRALYLVDGKSTFDEITKRAAPSLRAVLPDVFAQLVAGGYIRDKDKPVVNLQIATPKMAASSEGGELDFTAIHRVPVQRLLDMNTGNISQDVAAGATAQGNARSELEAAVEAAKTKARAEAEAKAEANARLAAEIAARSKAEAEVRAKQDTLAKEQAAAQVKLQLEATAKAKADAEALARQQIEAAARAKAEARAKQEAETARLKAEQEAARVKAELEAAKAKAEAEAKALAEERTRQEAEAARLKAEQETARIKAEQETARIKAEQEAAKAKAEAEAKALAEERARQEAEAVRLKAEQEAVRIKAEQLAAGQQATPMDASRHAEEVRVKAEQAAEKARQEATALKARQEEQRQAEEQARTWAAAEQRAKEQARMEAERPVQAAVAEPVKALPQKHPSARRKPLPLGKIAASLVLLALIATVALPYVMPLNSYIAPIEKTLSAQFKQPVRIGNLHAASLPWPKLQLENVAVGAGQELKVGNAEVTFDLLTLFSDVKIIRRVELRDVTLAGASFGKELGWLQGVGGNAAYPVAHVSLFNAKISSDEVTLPALSGEIDINGSGKVAKVELKSADAKFDVELLPAQDRWQMTLLAKETALPMFPNMLFSDLRATGEIGAAEADFAEISGQAYGGFLEGNAKLNWQKGWQLHARITARSVELGKLFPKFGVSGELGTESSIVASAAQLHSLGNAPQVEGSFLVKKGVVNAIDMVETARGNRQVGSGGRTHIDELTGRFQMNGGGPHFHSLKITSGILNGSGSFDVNGGSQLSGRFSVALKSRAGTSSLTLSGTLTEPVLR